MSFETKWDVYKYKDDTEYNLQWELRKSFMEAHKKKYPEARLVALSKVFANMEFMGCGYNAELMLLVNNLAKQVDAIVQYREGKTGQISRTFVKASDAVKKNQIPPKITAINNRNNKRPIELEEFDETDEDDTIVTTKNIKRNKLELTREIQNKINWLLYKKVRSQPGVKGKLIIHEEEGKTPKRILEDSAFKYKIKIQYREDPKYKNPNIKRYNIEFDNEIFGTIESTKKLRKKLKIDLASIALNTLKQYCFTVTTKSLKPKEVGKDDTINTKAVEKEDTINTKAVGKGNTINTKTIGKDDTINTKKESIEYTVKTGPGAKIMKLMGWKGEGLGKNQSGIKEPIEVELRVRRSGFGAMIPKGTMKTKTNGKMKTDGMMNTDFIQAIRNYLLNYVKSDEKRSLNFCSEFTKDERRMVHNLVKNDIRSLNVQSFGKRKQRALRISKKVSGWKLVEELLNNGDFNEAFSLTRPSALL